MHGFYWHLYRPPVPTKRWVPGLQPTIFGTLDKTLDGIGLVATGTVADASINGILDKTLDGITLVATGKVDVVGTLNATLGGISASLLGKVDIVGTLSVTLEGVGRTLNGTVLVTGTLNKTLDGIGLVATGTVPLLPISGTLSQVLDSLSLLATSPGGPAVDGAGQLFLLKISGQCSVVAHLQRCQGEADNRFTISVRVLRRAMETCGVGCVRYPASSESIAAKMRTNSIGVVANPGELIIVLDGEDIDPDMNRAALQAVLQAALVVTET